MKVNKNYVIAIAAGVAVAGLAGFLFGTDKGKNLTRNWRRKGAEMAEDVEGLVKDARDKFAGIRQQVLNGRCKEESRVATPEEA